MHFLTVNRIHMVIMHMSVSIQGDTLLLFSLFPICHVFGWWVYLKVITRSVTLTLNDQLLIYSIKISTTWVPVVSGQDTGLSFRVFWVHLLVMHV
jgi:hypothetical protein